MSAKPARSARWALSFADLCLVLLAFFVLMQAQHGDPKRLAAGVRDAFGSGHESVDEERLFGAAQLFEGGEAVLKPEARAELAGLGRQAVVAGRRVGIESVGADRSSARFDGWELGAARAAAVARAVAAGGLSPTRIDVSIPTSSNAADRAGQRISVTLSP